MRVVLLQVCLFILLANKSFAQETNKRDSLIQQLDSVLVIGQSESLKQTRPIPFLVGSQDNLINALDALPEIRKIHENGYPISFRGFHGSRIRIENNGVLRSGIVDQGYLMDDLNPENIGGVETITGIESIISGSGSLGGIIRILDKEIASQPDGFISVKSETNNRSQGFGFGYSNGKRALKYSLSGRRFEAQNFTYGNGAEAENSASDQLNLRLKTAFNSPNKRLNLKWNNEYSEAEFERPQGFQNNPNELRTFRNNYSYQSDLHSKHQLKNNLQLKQDLWFLAQDYDQAITNFNFDFSQVNVEENRNYQKESFGYRIQFEKYGATSTQFLIGADAIFSRLDENRLRNDLLNPSFSEAILTERNEDFFGLFSLLRLPINKGSIGFSFRGDIATIGDGEEEANFQALTGGIEVAWSPANQWKNEVSLTRKFRYPSQLEALGVFTGGRGLFFGNPNLKPEFSHQLEWKTTAFINKWELNLSSWLSAFTDRISEVPRGSNEFTYENIALARTYGLEASLGSVVWTSAAKELSSYISSSFVRGDEILTGEGFFSAGLPLIGIPPLRLRVNTDFNQVFSEKLRYRIGLNIDRLSALNRIPEGLNRQTWAVVPTDAYWLVNLDTNWSLKIRNNRLNLGLGITNLLNTEYFPFGARIMGMGRNFRFSTKFNF